LRLGVASNLPSASTRTGSSSGRTRSSPTNTPATGVSSRQPTSISTTTGSTTRSGSRTGWTCPTRCLRSSTTATRCASCRGFSRRRCPG